MKINLQTTKVNFGYVSARTIDMLRRELKETEPKDGQNKDPLSVYNDFKRIYDLTSRASDLQKTVIDTSGNNWKEKKTQQIVVRSHRYGGADNGNLEVFSIPRANIFDSPSSSDIIDTLEKAVEFAEKTEQDPYAHEIFDVYGWHGGVRENHQPMQYNRGMRSTLTENMLVSIYDNTLNLRSVK